MAAIPAVLSTKEVACQARLRLFAHAPSAARQLLCGVRCRIAVSIGTVEFFLYKVVGVLAQGAGNLRFLYFLPSLSPSPINITHEHLYIAKLVMGHPSATLRNLSSGGRCGGGTRDQVPIPWAPLAPPYPDQKNVILHPKL